LPRDRLPFEPKSDEGDQAGTVEPDTSFDPEALDADTNHATGAAANRGAALEPAGNGEAPAGANGRPARRKRRSNP
jgi:hypothetical protein